MAFSALTTELSIQLFLPRNPAARVNGRSVWMVVPVGYSFEIFLK